MDITQSAHFIMQSKGGAGKSVVATLLAQYLKQQTDDVLIVDTDPNNKTLGSYSALNVQKIEVLNDKNLIDASKFDGFINEFFDSKRPMIVDTGSGDFLEINHYMINAQMSNLIKEQGGQLYIHCPINFGQSCVDTVKCLISLIQGHPDARVILWQNEFFGKADESGFDLAGFEKANDVYGKVVIPKMNPDTDERDFINMLSAGLTFEEIKVLLADSRFGFIQKTRLMRIWKDLQSQLDALFYER